MQLLSVKSTFQVLSLQNKIEISSANLSVQGIMRLEVMNNLEVCTMSPRNSIASCDPELKSILEGEMLSSF